MISSLFVISFSFQGCQGIFGDEIKNPGFVINESETIPEFWALEGDQTSVTRIEFGDNRYKPVLIGGKAPVVLSQEITLPDSGSYFVIGKFRAEIENGAFFIEVKGISVEKRIEFTRNKEVCKRTLFSIHTTELENIRLSIGLIANTKGTAFLDTLFIYREKYFKNVAHNLEKMKIEIAGITGINTFNAVTFDRNVETIGKSINTSFLEKSGEEGQTIASVYSSDLFDSEQTSYLNAYVVDDKVRNSYCQKTSLSLDEILKLYKIPVRQIHWEENCSGVHQFTEYWNPYDQQWKLIDVYYGIRYVGNNGKYLGFEDVEKLVRENNFSMGNVEKKDIGRLYFKEDEILDGWENMDLAVRIIRK